MPVQYRFEANEPFVADDTADVSTSGVFLHSDRPCQVGSMVDLRIEVGEGSRVEGFGRVARIGKDAAGRAGLGIQFISFDDAATALIERLVAEHAADDVGEHE